MAALLGAAGPVPAAGAGLDPVAQQDLGARGLNSGLTLAGPCAYVGSRGQGPIEVVDVADPAAPRVVAELPSPAGTSARELRAVAADRLLVVLDMAVAAGGVNRLRLLRWTGDDCAHPQPAAVHGFGPRPPHEMYLWRSPDGSRTLLFVTMFSGGAADLQVFALDGGGFAPVGTWSPPGGLLHSIALTPDGHTAFLSLWTGGMLVADASDFTAGVASPALRLLTAPGDALAPLPGGNIHSAVPVPGRALVLVTDERYPPACPYGPARLVDVADPAHPRPVATLTVPENDLATCRAAPAGAYTSHDPTLTADLALVSWYSAGLQAFDISDPAHPLRLAELRPAGSIPGSRDPTLGSTQAMTWSYPVLRDGLVYVADINQGLLVVRYRGPHQEEVSGAGLVEGDSNLAGPTPVPAPSQPAPGAGPTPASLAPTAGAGAAAGSNPDRRPLLALALLGLGLAGAAALVRLVRARRR